MTRSTLPASFTEFGDLLFTLYDNPLNLELAEAYKQGFDAVKAYLRAKADAQIQLNEAKLILVGELENYLNFGKDIIASAMTGGGKVAEWMKAGTPDDLMQGTMIQAQGSILRELHTLLKAKDPSFGGLVRVMNKRQEFLWVHERFAGDY